MTEPKYTREQKVAQSLIIAAMMEESDRLDLDCLAEMISETNTQVSTIMPMLDPTRWMREHKGLEAAVDVSRAAVTFARVVRARKNPDGVMGGRD
jgi:hypothetical protein